MKSKSVISTVIYVAIFVAILGVIALVFAFINNGQKNFYVQYGDEKISYKKENVELPKNATSLFYCKNVLGLSDKQEKAKNFNVCIQANADALADYDFSGFVVGEKNIDFFRATDLTKGFDVQIGDGYFSLYLPETLTLQSVLEKVYAGSTVSGVPEINLYEKDYLQIVVTSEIEKANVTICFH